MHCSVQTQGATFKGGDFGTFLCNEYEKSFAEEAYLYIHQTGTHDKTLLTYMINVVRKLALKITKESAILRWQS